MPGARSSTKPWPAQGFSMTAATTGRARDGVDLAAPLPARLLDEGDEFADVHGWSSRRAGVTGGVGAAVPDPGAVAGRSRPPPTTISSAGERPRRGPARLVVAAGRCVVLVPEGNHEGFARLGPGVGEADDRLPVEVGPDEVAEVGRVDEGRAVLDLARCPDDRALPNASTWSTPPRASRRASVSVRASEGAMAATTGPRSVGRGTAHGLRMTAAAEALSAGTAERCRPR